MSTPDVHITCVANIFSKQMHFLKAGDSEQGHAHCFDHITLLAHGKLRLTALGTTTDFTAPHQIYIKADVVHELIALEDNTVAFCIHPLRDAEMAETIVDPASLPAYQTMETFNPEQYYPLVNPTTELNQLRERNQILEAELLKLQAGTV